MAVDVEAVERGPEAAPESTDTTPEVTEVVASAPEPVAESVQTPVAEPESEPATSAAPDYDAIAKDETFWQTPEAKKRLADESNARLQKREAEQRRELGKRDRVLTFSEAALKTAVEALGYEYDPEASPKVKEAYARAIAIPWDSATEVAAQDFAENLPKTLLARYDLPKEVIAEAVAARERGDWDGYLGSLLDNAIETQVKVRTSEIETDFEKRVEKRVAEELKAKDIEAARAAAPIPPPVSPKGGGAVGEAVPYHELTREQREAMTSSERDAYVARYGG